MKKILLVNLLSILLIVGCKKNQTNKSVASIKSNLLGSWYYNSYSVQYANAQQIIFTDVATATSVYNDPHYQFNSNNIGYYGSIMNADNVSLDTTKGAQRFTYTITVNSSGADSLLLSGEVNGKFSIVNISNNSLELNSNFPSSDIFVSSSGGYAVATNASSVGIFSRIKAVKPN